jgi:hypothetical protein
MADNFRAADVDEEWAQSMDAFAKAVEQYDGTPAYYGGEGLLATMAKSIGPRH